VTGSTPNAGRTWGTTCGWVSHDRSRFAS
jgi:hypothetical protein